MIIDYVTHTITTWQRNDKASLREEQKGEGEGGCREQREPKVGAVKKKRVDKSDTATLTLFPTKNIYKEILSF